MIEGTDVRTFALQVLLPGFAGTTLPDDYRTLLEQGLGGICYFGSNTADGPQAVAALSAGASLVPSPTMRTRSPSARS